MTTKREEKRREKRDSTPIFMPYTCPGCDKKGSVGFTLGSLPFDFICSSCGTPSHLRREDDLTVTLTFDERSAETEWPRQLPTLLTEGNDDE